MRRSRRRTAAQALPRSSRQNGNGDEDAVGAWDLPGHFMAAGGINAVFGRGLDKNATSSIERLLAVRSFYIQGEYDPAVTARIDEVAALTG